MEEYYQGKGCECAAHSEYECVCGVDWRSKREVQLELENKIIKTALEEIRDDGHCKDGEMGFNCGMCDWCLANMALKEIEKGNK